MEHAWVCGDQRYQLEEPEDGGREERTDNERVGGRKEGGREGGRDEWKEGGRE